MTIVEGAELLAEGRRLRRPQWGRDNHIRAFRGNWVKTEGAATTDNWVPRVEDLRATDWEEDRNER